MVLLTLPIVSIIYAFFGEVPYGILTVNWFHHNRNQHGDYRCLLSPLIPGVSANLQTLSWAPLLAQHSSQRDPIPPTLLSHHLGLKETPSGEFRVYRASIRLL